LGWVKLIKERAIDQETVARGLTVIERNANVQVRLIEQLLDFSRVNVGSLRLDTRKTSLVIVIEEAIDTMLPVAQAKEIDVRLSLESSTCAVIGDPVRLQQVMTNLLANAIKFTPSGRRVDVRLAQRESWAELTVTDTGHGIRPEFLPHVFEPFSQGNGEGPTAHDGLGLGLAIARNIVKGHGGEIKVESRGEGNGTTVTINLPLEDVATL
jgi:signal transduction histidine kinase